MIEWADVIVENFKPGTLERLIGPYQKTPLFVQFRGTVQHTLAEMNPVTILPFRQEAES